MTFTDLLTAAAAFVALLVFAAMTVVPFLLDHDAEREDLAEVVDLHRDRAPRAVRAAA